jgi:hypothetical protein
MAESERSGEYYVEVEYEKGSERPSHVFHAMAELIESFQQIDIHLAASVAASIEPIVILEEVEAGSIRARLATVLRSVDDEALKTLDWKGIVGTYLVRGKARILKYLDGKSGIDDLAQLEILEGELVQLAEETKIRQVPAYAPISRRLLLGDLNALSAAVGYLNERESAVAVLENERVEVPRNFAVSEEVIERLLTSETLDNEAPIILKVKKPDYLGNSMWEFRHEGHKLDAKMIDGVWLEQFHRRLVNIGPGDAIRARMRTVVNYDKFGTAVSSHREITKVLDVIPLPPGAQAELIWDE